jgi:CBS domain-containing protein
MRIGNKCYLAKFGYFSTPFFSEQTTADIEKTTAEDIMTPFVVEAYPEMNLREVSNIMIAKSVHRVIVLSPIGRKPVGLLSATDIVKQIRKIGG